MTSTPREWLNTTLYDQLKYFPTDLISIISHYLLFIIPEKQIAWVQNIIHHSALAKTYSQNYLADSLPVGVTTNMFKNPLINNYEILYQHKHIYNIYLPSDELCLIMGCTQPYLLLLPLEVSQPNSFGSMFSPKHYGELYFAPTLFG